MEISHTLWKLVVTFMEIIHTLWKLGVTFMEISCILWKFGVTGVSKAGQPLVQKGVILGLLGSVGVGRGWSGSVGEMERSPVGSARRNRKGPHYGNYVALSWKISIARLVLDLLWKLVALYGIKVSIIDVLWTLFIFYRNYVYFMEIS